jgi:hypothetical protein
MPIGSTRSGTYATISNIKVSRYGRIDPTITMPDSTKTTSSEVKNMLLPHVVDEAVL